MYGKDSDASITAFCLIAMQDSRTLCAASVDVSAGPHLSIEFSLLFTTFVTCFFDPMLEQRL